ncbi:carbon-nitrogen hydrolase family protein [Pseudoscardovia radai]|uniref:carbon-nitrogen hydrolase family protein n=1 Tax=Pseudoscardovia radai TaxID=987066 RepID=UPI0039954449
MTGTAQTDGASPITIAMAQYSQLPIGKPFGSFANTVRSIASERDAEGRKPQLVVFPEMHLFGTPDMDGAQHRAAERAAATDLHDDFARRLGGLARELGIWLIPGTVCEKNPSGHVFNTMPVFAPDGSLAATYRKICPWRPYEQYTPGTSFTTVDIPGVGRLGLTICYDAWFPEISRQVAWMGADIIINLVRTTTPDRRQELVLARANAIVNQAFVLSLNAPAPEGFGESILVSPEGTPIVQIHGNEPDLAIATVDLAQARRVRDRGTLGINRMWHQFGSDDATIPLPLYQGRIDPSTWSPAPR